MQRELLVAVTRIEGSDYSTGVWEQVRQWFQKLSEPDMQITLLVSGDTNLDGINNEVITSAELLEY
jgi:hypothetical protein